MTTSDSLRTLRRRNLDRLLNPASVAVIGASDDPARIGGRPVRYLKEAGFRGPVIPVNPKRAEVQGLKAYSSISAYGAPVDAAIIAVSAAQAVDVIRECAAAGVGGCVVFSANFAEAGPEGVARQNELTRISHETGIRIIGPNCLGLFNAQSGAFLTFSTFFDRGFSTGGRMAVITQSGGFGSHLIDVMKDYGIQVGSWVSTGNEADVEVGECISWAAEQENIDSIIAYTEGAKDGAALREGLLKARRRNKPVAIMKSGRSERGIAAASTHTAALAGDDAMYQGIFAQFGVRRAYSTEELADIAYFLQSGRLPESKSAVVLTASGAAGVQMADVSTEVGLDLPVLPAAVQDRIRALSPFAATANPVDITAQALNDHGILPGCMEAVAAQTDIGSFIIHFSTTADDPRQREPIFDAVREFVTSHPDKLVIMCMRGSPEMISRYEAEGVRVFSDCSRAVKALGRALWSPVLSESPAPGDRVPEDMLTAASLSEDGAKTLLQRIGIRVPARVVVDAPEQTSVATKGWTYPVVAKILSEHVQHKTELGGVRLGLRSPEEAETACRGILASVRAALPDISGEKLLLEEQVPSDAELILGVQNDPELGMMIMVGMGGIQAEIYKDVAFRMAPVDEAGARAMLDSLGGSALFRPFRGRGALDVGAVAKAVSELSRFAVAHSDRIRSMDINPLMVSTEKSGQGAVAVDCVVTLRNHCCENVNS